MHRFVPRRGQAGHRWRQRAAAILCALGFAVYLSNQAVASVSVVDATGHRLTLARPAQRIVALTPHLVENLFTVGLGAAVVGAVRYSDYPAAARQIPRVGGYRSVSLEALVARRPDLVVAWAPASEGDLIARLRGLGIAVYVDDPTAFTDIATTLRNLGTLGGHERIAEQAATDFTDRMTALADSYANKRPISVFYAVATEPLITIAGHSMIGAAIRLCGGRNIYEDAAVAAPRVGIESLIARDPEVIVASRGLGATAGPDPFWQRYPSFSAVRHDRFIKLPRDEISRPTVRMADATNELCRGLERVRATLTPAPATAPRP